MSRPNRGQYKNRGYYSEGNESYNENDRRTHVLKINRKVRDVDKINDNPINGDANTPEGIKRGSHSSQGSTASNHSSHVCFVLIFNLNIVVEVFFKFCKNMVLLLLLPEFFIFPYSSFRKQKSVF